MLHDISKTNRKLQFDTKIFNNTQYFGTKIWDPAKKNSEVMIPVSCRAGKYASESRNEYFDNWFMFKKVQIYIIYTRLYNTLIRAPWF